MYQKWVQLDTMFVNYISGRTGSNIYIRSGFSWIQCLFITYLDVLSPTYVSEVGSVGYNVCLLHIWTYWLQQMYQKWVQLDTMFVYYISGRIVSNRCIRSGSGFSWIQCLLITYLDELAPTDVSEVGSAGYNVC